MHRILVIVAILLAVAPAAAHAQLTFTVEVPDTAGTTGIGTSIVLDSQGAPRISFSNAGEIRFASKASGAWVFETLATNPTAGTSLALTSLDSPRIAYAKSDTLKYARRGASTWTIETTHVSPLGGVAYPSLALNSVDGPHIVFVEGGGLNHTYFRAPSDAWFTDVVDSSDGIYTSLDFSPAGELHACYFTFESSFTYILPGAFVVDRVTQRS